MIVPAPRWSLDAVTDSAMRRVAAVNVIGLVAGVGDRITEANDYFLDLLGYSRADLEAGDLDWPRLTPPEWGTADQAAYEEFLRSGVSRAYEKEYFARSGARVPVLVGGATTDAGPPPSWVTFVVDLHRLKAAEAEQARLLADAESARQRLAFLAEASALIATLPDYPGLFARLSRHVVADLADICLIDLTEDDEVHRVAAAAADLDVQLLLDAAPARDVGLLRTDPVSRVLRSGRNEAFGFDDRPADVAAVLDIGARAFGLAQGRSVLVLPLTARGRVLGALSLVSVPGAPPWSSDEREVAEEFARRAALAIDNARLLAQRNYVASTLQASLLPAQLPSLPGVELAARYVAAEELAEVGGDFYDVFPLQGDGESWGVVIGDVAGRGVEAAGLTGLARHTLRAVSLDFSPAAALTRLNDVLFQAAEGDRFLTAALLTLRLRQNGDSDVEVTLSSGGHCEPLLLRADGAVTSVAVEGSLLGALQSIDLQETTEWLHSGDLLLLYTDGVTEARGVDGLFGEERLAALLAECVDWPADAVLDRIVEEVARYRAGAAADDIALLAVRVPPLPVGGPPGTLLDLRLPLNPAAAGGVRTALTGLARDMSEEQMSDLRLIATELVTNAVRHARPDGESGYVDVTLQRRPDGLRLEVRNPGGYELPVSLTSHPSADAEGGRGLHVVQALCARWGPLTEEPGITGVWCEILLRESRAGRAPSMPAQQAAARPASAPPSVPPPLPGSLPMYGLSTVARLTGIPAQTILDWENRYGLVVAYRTEGGHELFSRDQLAAIHYVAALMAAGMPEADAQRQLGHRLESGNVVPPGPDGSTERVLLLAERDPYAAHLTEHLLRTAGYTLAVATDVDDALAGAATAPDLAIIDTMISGGRGLELVRQLKEQGTRAVLAVSVLRVADEALTAGADAFLPKPLQPVTLIAAVHDLLGTSAFLRRGEQP